VDHIAKNIFLIHGLMGTGETHFKEQIEEYKKGNYNVFAIDLPGHGKNTEDASDSFFEHTLSWLIKEIQKKEPGFIIGLSMGASFALHLAIKAPELVKGIILTGYVPFIPEEMNHLMKKQYDNLYNIKESNPEIANNYRMQHGDRWEKTLHAVVKCFTFNYPQVTDYQLKKLTIPAFILNGDNEKHEKRAIHHLASLNELIKPGVIPHCGHTANIENPSMFNKLSMNFISSIE
jgi:pimeloyl-ACP methyl ester carboxylesterase